ncbi:MAG: hypothetical protein WBA97_07850 [Actinophytocola sp.]|uniref:hypothetical protein n=1 Tax=Actinophytocola sp. TaxID=1872138 RepID=UPI003C74C3B6
MTVPQTADRIRVESSITTIPRTISVTQRVISRATNDNPDRAHRFAPHRLFGHVLDLPRFPGPQPSLRERD